MESIIGEKEAHQEIKVQTNIIEGILKDIVEITIEIKVMIDSEI
jgi:hypothetical protein